MSSSSTFPADSNRALSVHVTKAANTVNDVLSLVARDHISPAVFAETLANLSFTLPVNLTNAIARHKLYHLYDVGAIKQLTLTDSLASLPADNPDDGSVALPPDHLHSTSTTSSSVTSPSISQLNSPINNLAIDSPQTTHYFPPMSPPPNHPTFQLDAYSISLPQTDNGAFPMLNGTFDDDVNLYKFEQFADYSNGDEFANSYNDRHRPSPASHTPAYYPNTPSTRPPSTQSIHPQQTHSGRKARRPKKLQLSGPVRQQRLAVAIARKLVDNQLTWGDVLNQDEGDYSLRMASRFMKAVEEAMPSNAAAFQSVDLALPFIKSIFQNVVEVVKCRSRHDDSKKQVLPTTVKHTIQRQLQEAQQKAKDAATTNLSSNIPTQNTRTARSATRGLSSVTLVSATQAQTEMHCRGGIPLRRGLDFVDELGELDDFDNSDVEESSDGDHQRDQAELDEFVRDNDQAIQYKEYTAESTNNNNYQSLPPLCKVNRVYRGFS